MRLDIAGQVTSHRISEMVHLAHGQAVNPHNCIRISARRLGCKYGCTVTSFEASFMLKYQYRCRESTIGTDGGEQMGESQSSAKSTMAREALLVIDMSNDFVDDSGSLTAGQSAQAIVPYIVETADRMLGQRHVIVICMDTHEAGDAHFASWPPHNVAGTWGHQLFGPLQAWYEQAKENDSVFFIAKASYNAFYQTGLGDLLRTHDVATVHLTGVCTDICDFLTAAGAYDEGFQTVAHRRGCATFTAHHEIFLEQMERCFHTRVID